MRIAKLAYSMMKLTMERKHDKRDCLSCFNYYEGLDYAVPKGGEYPDTHICFQFTKGIDPDIWNGKKHADFLKRRLQMIRFWKKAQKNIRCKSCFCYDEAEDEIGRMYNENGPCCHYCDIYKNGIPEKIWKQEQDCIHYFRSEDYGDDD